MAVTGGAPRDYLRTYAETYLVQEVQAEALTRNLGAFARFIEIAARQNAQATNATAIARDAGIDRRTVQSHFAILTDTLIGHWLPAWKPRRPPAGTGASIGGCIGSANGSPRARRLATASISARARPCGTTCRCRRCSSS